MTTLKLCKIGSSLGVILPKDALTALDIKEGDILYLSQDKNGLSLSPYDHEFEVIMKATDECDTPHKKTLKQLVK